MACNTAVVGNKPPSLQFPPLVVAVVESDVPRASVLGGQRAWNDLRDWRGFCLLNVFAYLKPHETVIAMRTCVRWARLVTCHDLIAQQRANRIPCEAIGALCARAGVPMTAQLLQMKCSV